MCGIAGICRLDGRPLGPEALVTVKAMTNGMAYRGPDGEGFWQNGPVCLGHRRLSIIDLAGGSQPMHSSDGLLTVIFNGEIYNFAELKQKLSERGSRFQTKSDTEVILEAYRQWGTDCLSSFEGMFALALWDARDRSLFLARDRFGKKPLFYTLQQGTLYFASELTPLAAIPKLSLSISPESLMRYLAYEYVPTPQTIYAEVESLAPAHFRLYRDGHCQERRYWEIPMPDESDTREDEDICEELRLLLARAVRRRMVSDVPLGVFLSGGIDSTIVAGLMAAQSDRPVRTFSIGFSETSYDESGYARIVARAFGTDHQERILSASECADMLPSIVNRLDVPLADASISPTWLLSGLARQTVTVALGGDGADELWAGYEHYIAFKLAEAYNRLPQDLRHHAEQLWRYLPTSAGYINPRLAVETFLRGANAPAWQRVQTLLTALTPEMQEQVLSPAWLAGHSNALQPDRLFASTAAAYNHWQPEGAASPLNRAFHVYAKQFLLDDILVKLDRCSMLHSLEVRAPFLDRDMAEFTSRLPLRHKLRGFQRKYLLKKAMADLLPEEILRRNKRGFQIPVAAWLRGRLRPLMEDLLDSSSLMQLDIFDRKAIRRMMDEHISGRADFRKQLWTLLVLSLWWQSHVR